MKKYSEVLRKCPLFCGISEQNLFTLLTCLNAAITHFDKGETVLSEGEPADSVGIVLAGGIQIIRNDYWGNRSIVAGARPAELFGESFACARVAAIPVHVVASEHTDVMLIDCLKMIRPCRNACQFHQQLLYNLLKVVAEKNLLFHQKIEVTSKRTTREKFIAYLLLQAKINPSVSFEIPYSRQELADYLEVDRSGLSVEIGKLCRQGMIEVDRRKFKILQEIEC